MFATLDLLLLVFAFVLALLEAGSVPGPRKTSLGWFAIAAFFLTFLTP